MAQQRPSLDDIFKDVKPPQADRPSLDSLLGAAPTTATPPPDEDRLTALLGPFVGGAIRKGINLAGDVGRGIKSLPNVPGQPDFAQNAAKNIVAAPFDMIGNPRQNAPELLATGATLAAAPFTGGMSIPAGIAARSGIAAGAGGLGSYLRGDGADTIPLEGIKQLLFQLLPESAMAGLKGPLRSGSRAATNTSLRPSETVLNQMRDANGKPLANFKDRADVFAEGALDRGGSFSPGSSGYHKEIKAMGDAARGEKVDLLKASPATVTDQDILDEAAPAVRTLTGKYGQSGVSGEIDSLGQVDEALTDILERYKVAQGPLRPGSVVPPVVKDDGPWSMLDVDAKAGGLGKVLSKDYTQLSNAAATRRGARAPELNTDVDMTMRDAMSNITKRVPGVAPLDETISRNIPFESAAHDATMPEWGQLLPRPRVALQNSGMPNVSLFGYATRKGAGGAARPLRAASENSEAIGQGGAQLARLIQMLMRGNPDKVEQSGTVNLSGFGGGR